MSFPDIYAEATEAGIFDNIYGEQSLDDTFIEQLNVLEYDEPSFYSPQLSTNPYYLKAPVCSDLAEGEDFSFKYLQPTPEVELHNRLCDRSITFESPVTRSRPTLTSSTTRQLKTPAKHSARRSLLSPPPRIFPTKQVGMQGKKPKKGTFYRSQGYQSLYIAPSNWDIFEYNGFGELNPGRTYSAQELVRYLYSNPQNHVGETYNPKLGGLTLWVQRTPQDFATDYGHPEAALCRFQDCCEQHNNVIKAGDVRVAFDELTKRIPNLNPQRNAGYVHLSCLEKKTNFPMLCKDLDVKPEARDLPLEVTHGNPMILQERTVLEHVKRFIDFCNQMGRPPKSYPTQGRLIDEIMQLEPRKLKQIALDKVCQKKKREKNGGVEWDADEEDKAKNNQHSKEEMYNVSLTTSLKRGDDTSRPKKLVVGEILKKKKTTTTTTKRARAENERKIKCESEEEQARGGIKARAILKPRGRKRKAPSTPPLESESESDSDESDSDSDSDSHSDSDSDSDSQSDSSALTELDTETEEDEAPRRKCAKYNYTPTSRLPGRC